MQRVRNDRLVEARAEVTFCLGCNCNFAACVRGLPKLDLPGKLRAHQHSLYRLEAGLLARFGFLLQHLLIVSPHDATLQEQNNHEPHLRSKIAFARLVKPAPSKTRQDKPRARRLQTAWLEAESRARLLRLRIAFALLAMA